MDTHLSIAARSPRFEAVRWIIAPNGKSAIVRLTEPVNDAAVLVHRDVLIDGCLYSSDTRWTWSAVGDPVGLRRPIRVAVLATLETGVGDHRSPQSM